jgi:hypothetical protein
LPGFSKVLTDMTEYTGNDYKKELYVSKSCKPGLSEPQLVSPLRFSLNLTSKRRRRRSQPVRAYISVYDKNEGVFKMSEKDILFYAQIIIVLLTLIQSWINRLTLKEMKTSRIESVAPILFPELGARTKGVFDGETSYKFDLKVELNSLSKDEKKIELTPFDMTIVNIGRGSAYNIIVKKINKYPVSQSNESIRIIKSEDFKQIQFSIYMDKEDFLDEKNTIKITYENIYGEKYEQIFDFEIEKIFYQVKNIHFNKAKKI